MTFPGSDLAQDATLEEQVEREREELAKELKEKVQVEVRDAGTLRKEMRVTVPAEVLRSRMDKDFEELRSEVTLPGFRRGRAPIELVRKRYGAEVRRSLKTSVVGQSFLAAVEKQEFEALGDPLFRIQSDEGARLMEFQEALEHLDLREDEDLTYTCEVEVKPEVKLPELKGIEISVPKVQITDEMVDEQIERQRKIRGRFEPRTDGGAQPDDLLIADVTLKVDDRVVNQEANVEIGVRPMRLDGIPLENLGKILEGVKPGETRSVPCRIPDDYTQADVRGRDGVFEIQIHELKRLVPASIEDLVRASGAQNEAELRQFVRDDLEAERDRLVRQVQRDRIYDYLLQHVDMEIPPNLSARQTDRAVTRRIIEMQLAGIPPTEIEAQIDALRTSAREQVQRDLKLGFIMEKVAEQLDVTVSEEEVNTEIARIARRYGRRFDRVRDELAQRGLLPGLAEQIRDVKCVEFLLRDAKIVEVDEPPAETRKGRKAPARKTAKKTTKKPAAKKKTTAAKKTTKKTGARKPRRGSGR